MIFWGHIISLANEDKSQGTGDGLLPSQFICCVCAVYSKLLSPSERGSGAKLASPQTSCRRQAPDTMDFFLFSLTRMLWEQVNWWVKVLRYQGNGSHTSLPKKRNSEHCFCLMSTGKTCNWFKAGILLHTLLRHQCRHLNSLSPSCQENPL